MLGVYALARTPEPQSNLPKEALLKLFRKPLRNANFRKLLMFQSAWTFALSMSTPFFSVFMMKTIGLSLSYIIGLGLVSQVSTILSIKMWGRYADRFSNKTIISIAAPLFVSCMLGYLAITPETDGATVLGLLTVIHIVGGFSLAGISLAIDNFGMKLAPAEEAIVYISTRNIVVALIAALAPMLGGLLADVLATKSLMINLPLGTQTLHLLHLQGWNFLFLAGAILAIASLRLLRSVKEEGETQRSVAVGHMRVAFKSSIQENLNREALRSLIYYPVMLPVMVGKKVQERIVYRVTVIRRTQAIAEMRKRA
jgi:MFS family permease